MRLKDGSIVEVSRRRQATSVLLQQYIEEKLAHGKVR
jgi:hypothetical protein